MEILPSSPMPTHTFASPSLDYPMNRNSSLSDGLLNAISQTKYCPDDVSIDSKNEDISAESFIVEHNNLTAQLKNSIDEKDD